jgi:hypothetical protein
MKRVSEMAEEERAAYHFDLNVEIDKYRRSELTLDELWQAIELVHEKHVGPSIQPPVTAIVSISGLVGYKTVSFPVFSDDTPVITATYERHKSVTQ